MLARLRQDATDAAKNAAAMILTTEGLSAVFGAVVESRKIFARLFSYVSYRLAATIQILLYLSGFFADQDPSDSPVAGNFTLCGGKSPFEWVNHPFNGYFHPFSIAMPVYWRV